MVSLKSYFVAVFLLISCFSTVHGQVRLPELIDDGMVLQRNTAVKIWGWATKGESVTVFFRGEEYITKADTSGNWSVTFHDLKPGGPFSMGIEGENFIELGDIYVGDVWLCSGQSNMELSMSRVAPLYRDEISEAHNSAIRYFEVPKTYDFDEAREKLEGGEWRYVNQKTIRDFSAVAYFFAKELYEEYGVPIGLINSSLGGSPVEAWLSEEALKDFPKYYSEAQRFRNDSLIADIQQKDQERIKDWYNQLQKKDMGIAKNFKDAAFDASEWSSMNVPGYWNDTPLGSKNGVVWFRRKIEVPSEWIGKDVKLLMGRIVDADSVFVNGKFVGNTTYQYPPRRYTIPAGVLHEGENSVAIRVINVGGRGGFVPDKPYKMVLDDEEIDLTGKWNYKLGAEMPPLEGQTFIRWKPGGLYNAMINPLTDYTIKGAIWYQGESNVDTPDEYHEMFSTLIRDWRKKWGRDFPFLYVQLANFLESKDKPTDSNWARLREAQMQTLSVPKTGMAVAIDVGEWNDIHPLNKKAVGERLAQAAKKVAYGENVLPGGPLYDSFEIKDDAIVISFKNVGRGLMAKGGKDLKRFTIAGEDREFVWAQAQIRDGKVIVSSPSVDDPIAVRYAWSDNPEGANLYNKEGFPASPFRTDDWTQSSN